MSNLKKVFVLAIVALSFSGAAFAEENKGNSLTGFLRSVFNYPVKATQKTGEMTANTLNNTGEKVIEPVAANTTGIIQGDLAKTGDLAGDAISGTANTTGQAVAETAAMPIEAAQQ